MPEPTPQYAIDAAKEAYAVAAGVEAEIEQRMMQGMEVRKVEEHRQRGEAKLAAIIAKHTSAELATVKRQRDDIQAELVRLDAFVHKVGDATATVDAAIARIELAEKQRDDLVAACNGLCRRMEANELVNRPDNPCNHYDQPAYDAGMAAIAAVPATATELEPEQ